MPTPHDTYSLMVMLNLTVSFSGSGIYDRRPSLNAASLILISFQSKVNPLGKKMIQEIIDLSPFITRKTLSTPKNK